MVFCFILLVAHVSFELGSGIGVLTTRLIVGKLIHTPVLVGIWNINAWGRPQLGGRAHVSRVNLLVRGPPPLPSLPSKPIRHFTTSRCSWCPYAIPRMLYADIFRLTHMDYMVSNMGFVKLMLWEFVLLEICIQLVLVLMFVLLFFFLQYHTVCCYVRYFVL